MSRLRHSVVFLSILAAPLPFTSPVFHESRQGSVLRIVLTTFLGLFLTPVLHAQDLRGKISCWGQRSLQPQNRVHTKKLWDGYEISLGPTSNAAEIPEQAAALYNQGGHVVLGGAGIRT